jgi:hypothetical protein
VARKARDLNQRQHKRTYYKMNLSCKFFRLRTLTQNPRFFAQQSQPENSNQDNIDNQHINKYNNMSNQEIRDKLQYRQNFLFLVMYLYLHFNCLVRMELHLEG